jgi:hypothetical protein
MQFEALKSAEMFANIGAEMADKFGVTSWPPCIISVSTLGKSATFLSITVLATAEGTKSAPVR